MSPPAERRRTKEKPTGVTFRSRRFPFVKFREHPMQPGSPERLSVSGA